MKKTSLLVILSVVMILAFTGCLFMEKEASLEILGKKVIAFGVSQEFEIKITSSSAGGVGDVFAKDVQVKSVKWDFQNQEHAEGSFSKTIEGEEAKKYTPTFSTAPGDYRLSVTLVTTGDNTYEKTYDFEVVKEAPQKTIETFVGDAPISWESVQKNDQVEIKITLTDDQLSEEQVNNYEYKWEFIYSGKTDSSGFIKYGQSKTYSYIFTEKVDYTVNLTIKNPFGDIFTTMEENFRINTTKPPVPKIIGTPKWTPDGKKFEIEVEKDEDVFYYILEKKSPNNDQFYFVYRGMTTSEPTVKLYDTSFEDNQVTYRIYGVDGGDSKGNYLITTLDIPNRPPAKAEVVSPSGVFNKVVYGNNAVKMFWTKGKDPDLEDTVNYSAYIGNTPHDFDYLGTTQFTSIDINKQLESGKTYYLRVDSSDGKAITKGDISSFVYNPDINAPFIVNAEIRMDENNYQIWDFDFNDPLNDNEGYRKTYEVEVSKYTSFNDSNKFRKVFFENVSIPFRVSTSVGNIGDKLFIRMRVIYENQFMKITTRWSSSKLLTIIE